MILWRVTLSGEMPPQGKHERPNKQNSYQMVNDWCSQVTLEMSDLPPRRQRAPSWAASGRKPKGWPAA